jgi:heme/copper-type cytochrome/quinol oxidase subunit 2
MCKAAAESNLENDPKSIARGLNKGILFLMAIPYVIVGLIFRNDVVQIFKNIRNQQKIELSNERKQWLRFALLFATILIILFLIFLKVQYETLG